MPRARTNLNIIVVGDSVDVQLFHVLEEALTVAAVPDARTVLRARPMGKSRFGLNAYVPMVKTNSGAGWGCLGVIRTVQWPAVASATPRSIARLTACHPTPLHR